MTILSYNCRGLGTPTVVDSLATLVRRNSPSLVFFSETKHFSSGMEVVRWKCRLSGCIVVPLKRRAVGLALLWSKENQITLRSFSSHHIDAEVIEDEKSFRVTGFYGWFDHQLEKN